MGNDMRIPRSLAHRAAVAIELQCKRAVACQSCGANLDVLGPEDAHRSGCDAVAVAKELRKALEGYS